MPSPGLPFLLVHILHILHGCVTKQNKLAVITVTIWSTTTCPTSEHRIIVIMPVLAVVSLNQLSVDCGTTLRRQSGDSAGFSIFIYIMLPPHVTRTLCH